MPQPIDSLSRDDGEQAVDEITPLLSGNGAVTQPASYKATAPSHGKPEEPDPTQADNGADEEDKPMPYVQILVLCYASLAEPVAYFAIFPFINEMIERTGGLDESDVGFWSGMIESLFSLVQMVLMIFYGRMADKLGRKPVLVFSLAGVSVSTALFGLSRSLWQMVLFRCLAGVFAGSVVTVRTMLSEHTNKTTQGRAFSWYMFTKNMGIFLGPIVGGGLANPVEQFPGLFARSEFFKTYPYILATLVAGAVCLSATILALFFAKETLVRKQNASSEPESPMSTWEVLKSPGVPLVLYIFGHAMLLGLAFTAVTPVFQYTSIERGGWSFPPRYIASYLTLAGACQAIWMLVIFPPLQRTLGTGNLMRICCIAWPVFLAGFPVLNEILRHGRTSVFLGLGIPALCIGSGVAMGFACVQLFINDISPSSNVLGTLNALALTVNSAVRAFSPALFTSIFAVGVKLQWADGHLVWFVIVFLALLINVPLYFLPERAEGRLKKQPTANAQS